MCRNHYQQLFSPINYNVQITKYWNTVERCMYCILYTVYCSMYVLYTVYCILQYVFIVHILYTVYCSMYANCVHNLLYTNAYYEYLTKSATVYLNIGNIFFLQLNAQLSTACFVDEKKH